MFFQIFGIFTVIIVFIANINIAQDDYDDQGPPLIEYFETERDVLPGFWVNPCDNKTYEKPKAEDYHDLWQRIVDKAKETLSKAQTIAPEVLVWGVLGDELKIDPADYMHHWAKTVDWEIPFLTPHIWYGLPKLIGDRISKDYYESSANDFDVIGMKCYAMFVRLAVVMETLAQRDYDTMEYWKSKFDDFAVQMKALLCELWQFVDARSLGNSTLNELAKRNITREGFRAAGSNFNPLQEITAFFRELTNSLEFVAQIFEYYVKNY